MRKYITVFLNWLKQFSPPDRFKIPLIVIGGIFCGLGFYVLRASNAFSYLSDKPETCMNCHVMATQYATWERGNHGKHANCNDCHVPHSSLPAKYFFKASDGLRHSFVFTFRLEPQVIRIKHAGREVVEENCRRCHDVKVHLINTEGRYCWDCHNDTPHGRINSLSATPFARVPRLSRTIPEWLEALLTLNK